MSVKEGLGCSKAQLIVYIANTPPMLEYQQLKTLSPMVQGEISAIGTQCGNGWRKVFNVYAKLLFALGDHRYNFSTLAPTWQMFRDNYLLQQESNTALVFSPPHFEITNSDCLALNTKTKQKPKAVHLIMGRTYAKALVNSEQILPPLTWLNDEFAINTESCIIVCPYFDYRQLSNNKIVYLAELINKLS